MPSTPPATRSDTQTLDDMTGGVFSAPTSSERTAKVRDWLLTNPEAEQMQLVFKELSSKDKGAARPLREKLEELKRQREQEGMATEWADKARVLLETSKLNVADAMAWQRDAAKAGAPLAREPLAALKAQLAMRVKSIEDLQHRVQVQREAAVLLAQRIEVLSTKPWRDAQEALAGLQTDVSNWQSEAAGLMGDTNWDSVEARYVSQLEASRAQLGLVWEAFSAALAQTLAALADPSADLPQVPVWADQLRLARGQSTEPPPLSKPKADPEVVARASEQVRATLGKLEQEVGEGHGKASAGAAAALRQALKDHGRYIDAALDKQAHAALAAAGELEGWQRWRADQLRQELVGKAEALLTRPEGQSLGGRKMQETLRELRDQWKQTDQGGVPNHALWKRFDEACNQAHKVVEAWVEKIKAAAVEHRSNRLALLAELQAWTGSHGGEPGTDWKAFGRELHQFSERWREAGHLSEKAFAELQPQWKAAFAAASAPLDALQKESLQRRKAMIDEAETLGAQPMLRMDVLKSLQQRWQAEAHEVPLDRRQEQKLWDAFRKPIDEAFNRKTAEREKAAAAMSEHDRQVLEASKALEAANASGDAQAIRAAMSALEQALKTQAGHAATPAAETKPAPEEASGNAPDERAPDAAPVAAPIAARKPVVAVRGDDRPGMKKTEPAAATPGRGRPSDKRSAAPRRDARGGGARDTVYSDRHAPERHARLGDTAFRAQREALEHAQMALKKLSTQAHGEALSHLMEAWEKRDASLVPTTQDMGAGVPQAARAQWVQAVSAAPAAASAPALLRLEIAAEVPTPAADLDARRQLQLQLLTRRNEPGPAQTWAQDVAQLLSAPYEANQARRLQQVLKVLLNKR